MKTKVKGGAGRTLVRASSGKTASHRKAKSSVKSSAKGVNRQIPTPKTNSAKPVKPLAPKARAPLPRPVPDKQQLLYEEAVRTFQAQRYDRAEALFQKVIQGPNRTLAHHAKVHSQICRARLHPPEVKLKTAEDHYNYAVTMMNARRLDEAAKHLETAITMTPQADYLHYALAATKALAGKADEACERLRKAIELQPRNRVLARGDADFAAVLDYPPIAFLLRTA